MSRVRELLEMLLELAIEDPAEAADRARKVLAAGADPRERSYAHHALGIVHRDAGEIDDALRELDAALEAARLAGDSERQRDVRATRGTALVMAGRSAWGLRELDEAAAGAAGAMAAKILMRKAGVLALLGRWDEAALPAQHAARELSVVGDRVWEARSRVWLAHALVAQGRIDDAENEVVAAERLFVSAGADMERLSAVENRADIALARGDVATGLRLRNEVEAAYRQAGQRRPLDSVLLHAASYLRAGLTEEAVVVLRSISPRGAIAANEDAEFRLALATALLASGDAAAAAVEAGRAQRLFRDQDRPWFEVRANLLSLTARHAMGSLGPRDRRLLGSIAERLDEDAADEAPLALVLAGRCVSQEPRLSLWTRAASYRTHPNALVRAAAWHAQSLAHEERHNRGGVLRAAAAGLDAIDEHRRLIGSSELRALATTHGRDLTTIALRHAATDPRSLLRWSERTRATALAQPPATSDAATIPASLAALRDNGRRLAEARQEGEPTDGLERERLRLERAVRAESHTLSATTAAQQKPPSVEEIVAAVGDGCLVELVDVDGTLHVLVVHAGKVRRKVAGRTDAVAALLDPAAMLLRRASRGRAIDTTALGRQLEQAILGDAARLIPDGPVTLAPTARLHGLAWALLPVLGDRPFGVVPSAGQWLRAHATPRPRSRQTLLVSGPGLATGGAEVPLLAASHPDATLLAGADATLDNVLARLDGADLVHLAAHGRFRADSPLFSALDLADGPLTVHDLERVRRAPYRVVLSACESGVLAPVGAEELLGLAAALFSLGTAGLVSSVAEVNDAATADLMVDLHAALAHGDDPATALHRVRRSTAGDPVAAGTAAAFVALGV